VDIYERLFSSYFIYLKTKATSIFKTEINDL